MTFYVLVEPSNPLSSTELNKTSVFYIAVGVVFSALLVIASAVCYLHVRSMPRDEDENLLINQAYVLQTVCLLYPQIQLSTKLLHYYFAIVFSTGQTFYYKIV